jgi:RNA-directed DNA polymerase
VSGDVHAGFCERREVRSLPATHQILHCRSQQQAEIVRDAIIARLAQVGLELNLDKTRIVYCKDSNRTGSHEHERFDFLGYTFRPRRARDRSGELFVSFLPAVSDEAAKKIRRTIKGWKLHLWSGSSLADLAAEINPIVRGWINYYGRFYRTRLIWLLRPLNEYIARWATRKHKRLRGRPHRARSFVASVARRDPRLFSHWQIAPPAGG